MSEEEVPKELQQDTNKITPERLNEHPELRIDPKQGIYAVGGLQGSGKTKFAELLAKHIGTNVLETDPIRIEMFGTNPSYSEEEKEAVYNELYRRAKTALQNGPVVVTGTFWNQGSRDELEAAVERPVSWIEVEVDDAVAEKRLIEREAEGTDASVATSQPAGIRQRMDYKKKFVPFSEPHLTIPNNGTVEDLQATVEAICK